MPPTDQLTFQRSGLLNTDASRPGPRLLDSRPNRFAIGPSNGSTVANAFMGAGGTSLIYDAKSRAIRGVYVDDTTPHRDSYAQKIVELRDSMLPGGLVVVGLAWWEAPPKQPRVHSIPGCLCALEWYPFHRNLGRVPKADAYIVQWNFSWPNDTPPTFFERHRLLLRARAHRPKLILKY